MSDDRSEALKLFERAYARQRAGDLDDAVMLYQASIARYPTAEAHTFLGWVYSFSKRFDEAIACCKRAIAVDPSFGNPYNDIGVYLLELDRPDDAVTWFRRAMDADRYESPHFPHINLARVHESRGELLEALRELNRGVSKMPDDPQLVDAIRRLQSVVN